VLTALIIGAALTAVGLGGTVSACSGPAEGRDLVVAVLSGLAFAVGLSLVAVGAVSHGYHRRGLGEPPRDMDPHPQDSPPAGRPDL
jgi:cation transporter-like permease